MSPTDIQRLISDHEALKSKVNGLEFELLQANDQLAWFRRQVFGSKSERLLFNEDQTCLELGLEEGSEEQQQTETITYDRRKSAKKKGHGRTELPAHLRRETEVIEPDCDTSDMIRVDEKVTEQLECTPASYWVRRIVMPVYKTRTKPFKFISAERPKLCIEKGKAGASVVAQVLTDKCVDHLPVYRISQRIKRESGLDIDDSTLDGWLEKGWLWLDAISRELRAKIDACDYNQSDETRFRVTVSPQKGKSHLGTMWLRHAPKEKIVTFDYCKHRNHKTGKELFADWKGTRLQSDGLDVYPAIVTQRNGEVTHFGCWAHGRRKFDEALNSDRKRAKHVLSEIRELFAIEKQAREENLSAEERCLLRQEKAGDILERLHDWLKQNYPLSTPNSKIAKAIAYMLNRWKELTNFVSDGEVEISNNLIENLVRPFAVGRRNWLFAKTDNGARRLACFYTVLVTAKLNGLNTFEYLSHVLSELPRRKANDIEDLLPTNWKPNEK